MSDRESWFMDELRRRGVSRREFLGFCTVMTSALALPASLSAKVAKAIQQTEKPILVWLEFQDCCGNTESFLRAARPTVADIVLDTLSVDYHETIMAAAGTQAHEALQKVVAGKKGQYLVVVEGSIPTFENGAYCTVAGRSALDIAREVCGGAAATIAMGTCAAFGGLPAAAPNPTGALGVRDAVPGIRNLVNLPACPANAENITALLVHYLTFKTWPPLDQYQRPLFAYGKLIHDNCERRAHYDAGQYVEAWGDEGHRTGYCLHKMGCKGPVTFQNCPRVRWNEGTNWPIGCGHPCVGCAEPDFWDKMTPFYNHLQGPPFLGPGYTVDRVGVAATVGIAAAFATHGVISYVKRSRQKPEPETAPAAPGDAEKGGR
jgi:hydrogenase small subunit